MGKLVERHKLLHLPNAYNSEAHRNYHLQVFRSVALPCNAALVHFRRDQQAPWRPGFGTSRPWHATSPIQIRRNTHGHWLELSWDTFVRVIGSQEAITPPAMLPVSHGAAWDLHRTKTGRWVTIAQKR